MSRGADVAEWLSAQKASDLNLVKEDDIWWDFPRGFEPRRQRLTFILFFFSYFYMYFIAKLLLGNPVVVDVTNFEREFSKIFLGFLGTYP